MSNLVLNEFYDQENGAEERILQGIKHLQKQCGDLIIVTNEIFSDGVTYEPESERYIELLGRINRELGTDGGFSDGSGVWDSACGICVCRRKPMKRTKDVG